MASYLELFALKNDSDLQDRVVVGVAVAAETIRTETDPPANQAQRLAWARQAMGNPAGEVQRMLWAVLAANRDASVEEILEVDDTTLQTEIDAAVDLFAGV